MRGKKKKEKKGAEVKFVGTNILKQKDIIFSLGTKQFKIDFDTVFENDAYFGLKYKNKNKQILSWKRLLWWYFLIPNIWCL